MRTRESERIQSKFREALSDPEQSSIDSDGSITLNNGKGRQPIIVGRQYKNLEEALRAQREEERSS